MCDYPLGLTLCVPCRSTTIRSVVFSAIMRYGKALVFWPHGVASLNGARWCRQPLFETGCFVSGWVALRRGASKDDPKFGQRKEFHKILCMSSSTTRNLCCQEMVCTRNGEKRRARRLVTPDGAASSLFTASVSQVRLEPGPREGLRSPLSEGSRCLRDRLWQHSLMAAACEARSYSSPSAVVIDVGRWRCPSNPSFAQIGHI